MFWILGVEVKVLENKKLFPSIWLLKLEEKEVLICCATYLDVQVYLLVWEVYRSQAQAWSLVCVCVLGYSEAWLYQIVSKVHDLTL